MFFKIFVKDFLLIDESVNSLCDTCFKRNERFCLFSAILGGFVMKLQAGKGEETTTCLSDLELTTFLCAFSYVPLFSSTTQNLTIGNVKIKNQTSKC